PPWPCQLSLLGRGCSRRTNLARGRHRRSPPRGTRPTLPRSRWRKASHGATTTTGRRSAAWRPTPSHVAAGPAPARMSRDRGKFSRCWQRRQRLVTKPLLCLLSEGRRAVPLGRTIRLDERVRPPAVTLKRRESVRDEPDQSNARRRGDTPCVSELPTGTVTFLFTEIEGSTQ